MVVNLSLEQRSELLKIAKSDDPVRIPYWLVAKGRDDCPLKLIDRRGRNAV